MPEYTVIGLRDNDTGEFHVAGVVLGRVDMVDTEDESGGMQRYATSVTADDVDEAERLAAAEIEDEDEVRGCSCGEADYGTPGHDGDDQPCPCGKSHTRAEHGYDPDRDPENLLQRAMEAPGDPV